MFTIRGGYHGDTFSPMSVCDPDGGMHAMYAGLVPAARVRAAAARRASTAPRTTRPRRSGGRDHGSSSSSTPTRSPRSSSSRCCRARAACTSTPALPCGYLPTWPARTARWSIFDEIATGFWRTGTAWAHDRCGVAPDILCVGKALTGGYLSLAAVLTTCRGRAAGRREPGGRDDARPDVHGEPAGLRGRLRQPRPARVVRQRLPGSPPSTTLERGLAPARDAPGAPTSGRSAPSAWSSCDRPVDVPRSRARRSTQGVWVRPFRNLVYTMPPYVSSARRPRRDHLCDRRCRQAGASVSVRGLAGRAGRAAGGRRADPAARRLRPRRPLLDLAGNDYLGLARDPRVVAAAVAATKRYGAGAGASRLVSGTLLDPYRGLERALADFTGFPAALVFSTGYHANLSVVSALADRDTLVVSDAHVHASLIDACRLARADGDLVPHNDVDAVRGSAGRPQPGRGRSYWSRRSTRCSATPPHRSSWPRSARRHGACSSPTRRTRSASPARRARTVADAGLARATTSSPPPPCPSRSVPRAARCSAAPAVREHLINRARPFIYDTGLAPAAAGAALAALRVIEPNRSGSRGSTKRRRRWPRRARSATGRRRAVGADARPAEAVAAVAEAAGARRTHRLLPPTVHTRRDLPAAADRARPPHRRRAGAGGQGAARGLV